MTYCVLDGSTALAWVLPGETDLVDQTILDRIVLEGAVAPAIWPIEVANVLSTAERRGRITRLLREKAHNDFRLLPLTIEPLQLDRLWRDTYNLAEAHRLSVYDAMYLETALRWGLPLATLDKALLQAASACGVQVL